jgi:hypothetical protein
MRMRHKRRFCSSKAVFDYCKAFLQSSPVLRQEIEGILVGPLSAGSICATTTFAS